MVNRTNWIIGTAFLIGTAIAESAEPIFPSPLHAVIIGLGMSGFVQLRLLARKQIPKLAVISELGFSAFAAYCMYALIYVQHLTTNAHVINAMCGMAGMGGGVAIASIGEKLLGWRIYVEPTDKNGP